MKGRNLGWGLEIWGLIKCKSKVGLGHFDKSAGPLAQQLFQIVSTARFVQYCTAAGATKSPTLDIAQMIASALLARM